ncbi:2Fe-2S iron-sulfur cluster-binding protein [Streptomyces sp. NPDC003730]
MTDDQHGDEYGERHDDRHTGGRPPSGGRWDPLPQGDYDDGATAFVQLPEGGVDALLASADSPLAAPGHGYVPPQITVTSAPTADTDPAATGSWTMPSVPSAPVDGAQWQAPDAGQEPAAHQGYGDYTAHHDPYGGAAPYDTHAGQGVHGQDVHGQGLHGQDVHGQGDPYGYRPGATGQWDFSQAAQAEAEAAAARHAPGQDVTGQWSIPVAGGDLPDESGEFTTSSLAEQWGTGAPATLPGGAPAPWATQPAGQPWDEGAPQARPDAGERPADRPWEQEAPHPGPAGAPYADNADERYASDDPYTSDASDDPYASDGRYASDASDDPYASAPADDPYAHRTGEPPADAAEAPAEPDPAAPAGDGTDGVAETGVTGGHGEPGGSGEAPEGPAERPARSGGPAAPEPHAQAAEGPVTGSAQTSDRDHADPGESAEPAEPTESAESAHEQAPEQAPEPEQEHGPAPEPGRDRPDGQHPDAPAAPADAVDARTGPEDEARPDADPEAPEAAPAAGEPSAPAGPQDEHPLASYVLRVNGTDRPVTDAWIGESLLYVLRERLGLAGAKDGCSQGECGACNVQVDGRLVASCLVPSVTAAGSEVRTVEGLAADGRPSDVQRALARRGAVQCGFCVPGMAMTVHNLLEGNPAPTELETRQALCGNLCRCSGYRGVLEAVKEVVAEREAHAEDAQAGADSDEPRIPHQAGPGAGGVNPAAFGSQPPPGPPDATGPHDQAPYGDHGNHGQDGGHA